jgi:fumarylacetoacetate (FAA) hydrolase family protein
MRLRNASGFPSLTLSGDAVRVSTPTLGALVNRIRPSDACEPWDFGVAALFRNLVARGVL